MHETKEYWSMTEGVFNCLFDKERTEAFAKAIQNTVKEGDVVVDMGTGSGILAMLAAQAGAKKVYAIEFDENNYRNLEKVFKVNGFDQIVLLNEDVRSVEIPEKVDVIIGEMIATGLIEEQQIQAMNNILKYTNLGCKTLLKKYTNYIDCVYNKDQYYGLQFPIVRYEYSGESELESWPLTGKESYSVTDFSKITSDEERVVDKTLNLVAIKDGKINGIRISSETEFSDGTKFWGSFAYSYPIILPVEDVEVKEGDRIQVKISYVLCGGFNNLKYSLNKD